MDDTGSTVVGGRNEASDDAATIANDAAMPALDAWAEAMAESAILTATPRAVPSVPMNQQVRFFLDRFTIHRREVVDLWIGRSGRYLGMIREVLRNRGLPDDLVYVAMIESGFNPLAVSRVGAKGMWQFMARTARSYGLRVDRWVDERFDPEKSTVAAAKYLRDLHGQFGSWALAQAAYNAGDAVVTRAIRKVGSTDFWTLCRSRFLRRETKEFVPQIEAASLIGRDPGRYGFDMAERASPPIEVVTVPPATNLRTLATAAGLSSEVLRSFNPVLIRGVTPPGTSWPLRVPAAAREDVIAGLARLAATKKSATLRASIAGTEVHVVRARDTLSSIAQRYGLSVPELLRMNRLDARAHIHAGDRLRVADLRVSADRSAPAGTR